KFWPMQMTALGRAMAAPTRSASASASSGSSPASSAARVRPTGSSARKSPFTADVGGRRSKVRPSSMTTGVSCPNSPSRANFMVLLLLFEAAAGTAPAVDSIDIGCLHSKGPRHIRRRTRRRAVSRIVALDTSDIRFPTSLSLDGSDAMNPDPDYSAAYVIVRTDAEDAIAGHSFVFTIGRGNDVQVAGIDALAGHLVGREIEPLLDDMGGTFRDIIGDSQLRWLGPEKGVMHMAIGAVINALWDIKAKRAGLPLWQLLGRMTPEELVDLVDFRYLTDALTRAEALATLPAAVPGRAERGRRLLATRYAAHTTSPGWLGYSDEKLERLAREAMADGFTQIKLKVGADLEDDIRRFRKAREVCGPDFPIAIDANQRWEVSEAIEWVNALAEFHPA